MKSAFTTEQDAARVAQSLTQAFGGTAPGAIVFFGPHTVDGASVSEALGAAFPGAQVMGCTSAGEFTDSSRGTRGVAALAFESSDLRSCAAALVEVKGGDVDAAVGAAARSLEEQLQVSLREVPPGEYVGVVLLEGLKMREERINEALGNAAPLVSFVGGSAGDDLRFEQTHVFLNGRAVDDGAALLVLRPARPFVVVKSCSFASTGKTFRVTKADVPNRVVHELDGRPVLDVYAEAAGVMKEQLDSALFMDHPVGLLIDGKPWVRSPQRVLEDGGLKFYCQILEGMEVHLLQSTDLVGETRAALAEAAQTLGGPVEGGLAFNCILRRLEIDAKGLSGPFYESLSDVKVAGFHTYGESWVGHINQTFTGLLFA